MARKNLQRVAVRDEPVGYSEADAPVSPKVWAYAHRGRGNCRGCESASMKKVSRTPSALWTTWPISYRAW